MSVTVGIEDLRVGMFVHLDLGWWAHPFALSSFVVSTPAQIDTLRGLGLKQLRWSPEKSVAAPAAVADAPVPAALAPTPPALADGPPVLADMPPNLADRPSALADSPSTLAPVNTAPGPSGATPVVSAVITLTPAALPAAAGWVSPLAAQRQAQQVCEQQYLEAGQAWQAAQRALVKSPAQAREITHGLTRALLDKMMVDGEMCVRVLSGAAGDPDAGHAMNVAVISLLMARVFGCPDDELQDIGMGALLHDVGKQDLPERHRHADTHTGGTDLVAYRSHVALGVAQGQRMGLNAGTLAVLAQHHEMADGSGFPQALKAERTVMGARIVALVNRYDRLCNPAQAALGLTPHEALSLIFAQSRNKFDATMLNAFIRMMGVYPPGSVVQLTDERYATVVSVNSSRPLKPRVLVCDTAVPVEQALLLNLDTLADLGIRRSLKPAQLPASARDYLSPRQRMVYFFEPVVPAAARVPEAQAA